MSATSFGSPEPVDPLIGGTVAAEQASDGAASELIVDAAPTVAYPDRPWVMIAGVIGALALGTIVFTTMVSAQKRAGAGDVTPTRDAKNDGNLGQNIPEPPSLFAQWHRQLCRSSLWYLRIRRQMRLCLRPKRGRRRHHHRRLRSATCIGQCLHLYHRPHHLRAPERI